MEDKYVIEDEENDMECGFDYESFIEGFYCKQIATKVIVEVKDGFHCAHLCDEHANKVLKEVNA